MDDFTRPFGDWWMNDAFSPAHRKWSYWYFDYDYDHNYDPRPNRPSAWAHRDREWTTTLEAMRDATLMAIRTELANDQRLSNDFRLGRT